MNAEEVRAVDVHAAEHQRGAHVTLVLEQVRLEHGERGDDAGFALGGQPVELQRGCDHACESWVRRRRGREVRERAAGRRRRVCPSGTVCFGPTRFYPKIEARGIWRVWGRTGDGFGVRGGSGAAAVYVGRDIVDLLAVLVRHGLPVGRSSVRAQDHATLEAHACDCRARLHRSLELEAVLGHHLVPRDIVEVKPAPLIPIRNVRRANVARCEQRHLCFTLRVSPSPWVVSVQSSVPI